MAFTTTCGNVDNTALKWTFTPVFRDAGQKDCEIVATDTHKPSLVGVLLLKLTIEDSVRLVDVAITAPPDNFVTNQSSIVVEWIVDNKPQPKVTKTLIEGPNVLKVLATDTAGNK